MNHLKYVVAILFLGGCASSKSLKDSVEAQTKLNLEYAETLTRQGVRVHDLTQRIKTLEDIALTLDLIEKTIDARLKALEDRNEWSGSENYP